MYLLFQAKRPIQQQQKNRQTNKQTEGQTCKNKHKLNTTQIKRLYCYQF